MKSITLTYVCLFLTFVLRAQEFHSSWVDPLLICNTDPIKWTSFEQIESWPVEEYAVCLKPFESIAQVWLKVKVKNRAELGFDISPANPDDDIDFIVFKSRAGMPIEALRCMATGLQLDKSVASQSNCAGSTGLKKGEFDLVENPGCTNQQSNYLRPISTESGDEFLILITNYQSKNGFSLTWNGDAVFDPGYCLSEASSGTQLLVTPNPASQWLNCIITTDHPVGGMLRLFSQNGTLMEALTLNLSKGSNTEKISLSAFPSGKYLLVLHEEDHLLGYSSFEIVK